MQENKYDQALRFEIFAKNGVLVLPERVCVKHDPAPGCVLIRIQDQDQGFLELDCSGYEAIAGHLFADIDQPSWYSAIMEPDQARLLAEYMIEHLDKKLVVHCQAGISRSSAVACAWLYLRTRKDQSKGLDDLRTCEDPIRKCHLFQPNMHVYRLLVNAIEDLLKEG